MNVSVSNGFTLSVYVGLTLAIASARVRVTAKKHNEQKRRPRDEPPALDARPQGLTLARAERLSGMTALQERGGQLITEEWTRY